MIDLSASAACLRVEALFRLDVLHMVEQHNRAGLSKTAAAAVVAATMKVSSSSIRDWFARVQGCARADWHEALVPDRMPPVLHMPPSLRIGRAA